MSLDETYASNFDIVDIDVICETVKCIEMAPWVEQLSARNINITDIGSGTKPIDILIGADVAGKLLITEGRRCLENGLVAIETLLGWTVMGEISSNINDSIAMTVTSMFLQEADISSLWRLDVLGINDPDQKKSITQKDNEVKQKFLETVKINHEGRFEVELPWVDDHPELPDNFEIAKARLENTMRKLKNENYLEDYEEVFENWIDEGIIELVPDEELNDKGHYLPHRHVIKEGSTTLVRPVFDGSASQKDKPSLNHCLEKGPNLIELIPTINSRFRKRKIGVIADIKAAFLQISIAPKDRNFLRFLWHYKGFLRVFGHERVVFGVSCSPFLLMAVIELLLDMTKKGNLKLR